MVQDSIGLDSFPIMRDLIKTMFDYDVFNDYIKCLEVLNLIGLTTPVRNIRNSDLFRILKLKTNCGKNLFFTRAL